MYQSSRGFVSCAVSRWSVGSSVYGQYELGYSGQDPLGLSCRGMRGAGRPPHSI